MKKLSLISCLIALFVSGGCSHEKSSDSDNSDKEITEDTLRSDLKADSALVNNIPFEVRKFEKKKGNDELEVEYPVGGNPELVKSVRNWISEQLTGTYRGNLEDAEAFFKHYAANLGDPDLEEFGGYIKDNFKLEYTNDYIITYKYTSYINEGEGAHDNGGSYGFSFLQTDGTLFSKDCFTSYTPMQPLFTAGLKQFFNVNSDSELIKKLNSFITSVNSIAPPAMNPWILRDSVIFSYTPDEIAPETEGTPFFKLGYSQVEPYLTAQGKKFFGK